MSLFISRSARRLYRMPVEFFEPDGRLRVAGPEQARSLARHLREIAAGRSTEGEAGSTDEEHSPGFEAGQLNALSILGDILEVTLERLLARDPDVLLRILERLDRLLTADRVDAALEEFALEFGLEGTAPPDPALRKSARASAKTVPRPAAVEPPDRPGLLGSLILFWVTRLNTPAGPIRALLDGEVPVERAPWAALIDPLIEALDEEREISGEHSLLPLIRGPVLAGERVGERLAAARSEAVLSIPPEIDRRLSFGLDILAEEERPRFPPGPGPLELPSFESGAAQYADDKDWMPGLVLIAKNVRVWLHQLSLDHGRELDRLDRIPDSELRELARRGISGLWLIGLWERSPASQRIKRLCGNPEAGSSAYAIRAYRVAQELGGEEALADLRRRSEAHGIRLGADMVANHLAIDSEWLVEHPERFLSVPSSPFPDYSFEGPDLSPDPSCSIHLEQHYFDRSDAAVVFRRIDRKSGEVRYIYHGNDGTSVPWNDTAQLDYLNPETRQAVVESIVEAARKFPILRFDAAMTLTRHHYQRLWHPAPGSAGAIPSRAEHGLDAKQFDAVMPQEFWSGVVEQVGSEAPDTLLLAEAFWLTESFFVRTLGMHRVYNSAFMNMIREGKTAMFRELVARTLLHDPRTLERQVNFLSNPDERTAIDQFGDGDRYFGACVMLATLPGLPMLGHGQVEGLHERYGMEYERAYQDERPSAELLERHEREIFPLLRRRRMFAEATHFRLYEALDESGAMAADLIAYSNRGEGEGSLVAFNNGGSSCRGWLHRSLPFARVPAESATEAAELDSESVDRALGAEPDGGEFLACRDLISGRETIRRLADIRRHGFEIRLEPWGYAVYSLFRQLRDDEHGLLDRLTDELDGEGVADLVAARLRLAQAPLIEEFRQLVLGEFESPPGAGVGASPPRPEDPSRIARAERFLRRLASTAPGNVEVETALEILSHRLAVLERWDELGASDSGEASPIPQALTALAERRDEMTGILWIWSIREMLGGGGPAGGGIDPAIWDADRHLADALEGRWGRADIRRVLHALRIARRRRWGIAGELEPQRDGIVSWLQSADVAQFVALQPKSGEQLLSRRRLLDLVDLRLTFALLCRDDREAGRLERWWLRRRRITALRCAGELA